MEAATITDEADDLAASCPALPQPALVKIVQLAEEGKTWDEIADAIKVHRKTVWRWRVEHQIDAIIAQRNQDALRATLQHRIRLVRKASEVLEEWLDGADLELKQYAIDKVYPKQSGDTPAPALQRGKPEDPKAAAKRLAASKGRR